MVTLSFTIFSGQKNYNRAHMLFQVLCGFEPIFYTTHPNEESKKCGPLISCTHFLRKNGEAIELDFEIMVPIDKDIPLTLEFCMCDKFYIEKVLDIHVVTSKFSFEKEMTEINQYIRENNILPKTATYSFLEKDDNEMIDTHIIFGI